VHSVAVREDRGGIFRGYTRGVQGIHEGIFAGEGTQRRVVCFCGCYQLGCLLQGDAAFAMLHP